MESLKCKSKTFELYFIGIRSHWSFGGKKVTNLAVLWKDGMKGNRETLRILRPVWRSQVR